MQTREKLHGFKPGHTQGFSESRRISFLGNSFHCIAVAYLLSQYAYHCRYLSRKPFVEELWERAGYPTESDRDHGRRRYAVFHVTSIIATSVREQGIALKSLVTMDHMSVPCSEVCQRIRVKRGGVR